ncbi:MAG: signal peptidase I [Acidiferrobacterales bacterium]
MDFSLLMFVLLIITGGIWALEHWLWAPKRAAESGAGKSTEPISVEYAKAFFPVILIVFLLRSFLVEPFHIPSGSMMPGLIPGDFILVNKFKYGIRLPILNTKVIGIANPKRGDVIVFRYPKDPSTDYIKRVIGLPGDRVVYSNKTLYINGKRIEQYGVTPEVVRESNHLLTKMDRVTENLGGREHHIYVDPEVSPETSEFDVPEHSYFVMGDNRDRSNDSRYWGFVNDRYLVGNAFMIWLSWDETTDEGWFWSRILWNRIGKSIS